MAQFWVTLFLCGAALVVHAEEGHRTELKTVSGTGSHWGTCDGQPGSFFCVDQIKKEADRSAVRDADWNCHFQGGTPDISIPLCSNSCFPSDIPAGAERQSVHCHSTCRIRCAVPTPTQETEE